MPAASCPKIRPYGRGLDAVAELAARFDAPVAFCPGSYGGSSLVTQAIGIWHVGFSRIASTHAVLVHEESGWELITESAV